MIIDEDTYRNTIASFPALIMRHLPHVNVYCASLWIRCNESSGQPIDVLPVRTRLAETFTASISNGGRSHLATAEAALLSLKEADVERVSLSGRKPGPGRSLQWLAMLDYHDNNALLT